MNTRMQRHGKNVSEAQDTHVVNATKYSTIYRDSGKNTVMKWGERGGERRERGSRRVGMRAGARSDVMAQIAMHDGGLLPPHTVPPSPEPTHQRPGIPDISTNIGRGLFALNVIQLIAVYLSWTVRPRSALGLPSIHLDHTRASREHREADLLSSSPSEIGRGPGEYTHWLTMLSVPDCPTTASSR